MKVTPGSTDITTFVVLRTAADGVTKTGATIADIDLQYCRLGAEPSAKVDATALAATDTEHTDNYGIEIDATDQPGLYRIDWPDAAFATGVREVILSVKLATCFTEHIRVKLETRQTADVSTVTGVCTETRLAQLDEANMPTDLDNIFDDVGDVQTTVDAILLDTGTTIPGTISDIDTKIDTIDTNVDAVLVDTGTTIPATLAGLAAATATAVWNSLLAAMTTANSIGKALADWFAAVPAGATPFTATDLSLCNNALLLLGNTAIDAITDNTKAAKLCSQFYQQSVDAVLRAYTWNAATYRSAALTATTTPSFGFSYAFTLPDDCLRVLMIEDEETIPFRIESGVILTDDSTCKISYIKRITPDNMGSLLIEAISARLAATMAFSLTNSTSGAEAMWKLYEKKLDEAQTIDAFEGTPPQMASNDWVNSRS